MGPGYTAMHAALSLSFLHVDRTCALDARLREIGERLLRQSQRVLRCHIAVEGSPGSRGAPYSVKIHLSMPGAQIHACSTPPDGARAPGLEEALKEAYVDARRQLQEIDRQRSMVLVLRPGS